MAAGSTDCVPATQTVPALSQCGPSSSLRCTVSGATAPAGCATACCCRPAEQSHGSVTLSTILGFVSNRSCIGRRSGLRRRVLSRSASLWAHARVGLARFRDEYRGDVSHRELVVEPVRACGAALLETKPQMGLLGKSCGRWNDRACDLHVGRVSPGHCAAVVSMVSDQPEPHMSYKIETRRDHPIESHNG